MILGYWSFAGSLQAPFLRGRFETHGKWLKDGFGCCAAAFKHPIFARSAFPKKR